MSRRPHSLSIDLARDPGVLDLLSEAAAGRGPLLVPHEPGADPGLPADPRAIDTRILPEAGGIALGTSGSSGAAKRVVLSPSALAASADATHSRLGGPGQWLLTLPPHHIAGMQVVLRTLRAGQEPARMPTGTFTPSAFTTAVAEMTGPRRYTSLVPTQIARILTDDEATAACASLDGVLVGGSRVDDRLLRDARAKGIPMVVTYGMSETAGGCVYDGRPLDGVQVCLVDDRIHLTGDMLASGYLLRRDPTLPDPFIEHEGRPWFRTDDIGHLDAQDRLVVDGRIDDVIISGGLKVWPAEVEQALAATLPVDHEIAVVGVPDSEWGQRVAVVVECTDCTPSAVLTELLDHARDVLPPHARPRLARTVRSLPRLGPGKPDRARLTSLLMDPQWDDGHSTSENGRSTGLGSDHTRG